MLKSSYGCSRQEHGPQPHHPAGKANGCTKETGYYKAKAILYGYHPENHINSYYGANDGQRDGERTGVQTLVQCHIQFIATVRWTKSGSAT